MSVFFKIKNLIKNKYHIYMCKYNQDGETLWLSLGENCLADNLLLRFHKKSYSTLFSSARSNIEYILDMHLNNYTGLFSPCNVKYGTVSGDEVLRSSLYNISTDGFHPLHLNGFEFTHHDFLKVNGVKEKLENRINRLNNDIGVKNIIFLYHHRYTEKSNLFNLRRSLSEFSKLCSKSGKKCRVVLFYQSIIDTNKPKELIEHSSSEVIEFELKTHEIWEGANPNIFWAHVDNKLLSKMFSILDSRTF